MKNKITLRGMTWNHSRGFDPMVATSAEYARRNPNVEIIWEKRSLQAFADRPIGEMADAYDLMVIDHPHVGEVAQNGLLAPLDGIGRDAELIELDRHSIGNSHASYQFDGRQWALAIDAATPVACYRGDLLNTPPTTWDQVLELAKLGKVGFALIPINALMTFFGLAQNKGYPIAQGDQFMAADHIQDILETLLEITGYMDKRCFELDPIGIYEWMGRQADAIAYSPFGYGYTNYSRNAYCRFPLTFADAPGFGDNGPRGTVLGGTGIAVSARSKHINIATDYAFWIAGPDCQRGLFFTSGGQPAHAAAWDDDACNAATRNFFRNTRRTLDTSWIRPRYDGYMQFQDIGGTIVHECLTRNKSVAQTISRLNSAYGDSLK